MIVVSDTSPVLNLSAIGRMKLLHDLYSIVIVPPMVIQELRQNGFNLEAASWIEVKAPQDGKAVRALYGILDPGESESIVLAQELHADLLLIDERRGWKVATARGLTTTGLLGVLAEAKKKGLIAMCRPILDDMTKRSGFWVGKELRAKYLAALGETEL